MISFCNDYSEGACDEILVALQESNRVQSIGYGEDEYCLKAKEAIYKELDNKKVDIHFLVGGTQANLTIISAALRPYEAVIAVDSGHINVHETGAIEASGHKVVIAKGCKGKISVEGIREVVQLHNDEHMVKPAMVYISNATEIGTIYHKDELIAISKVCKELGLFLFMDGARMGAALSASDNDLSFADVAKYCDVFYIGGTKNGALFGECVVIVNEKLKKDFRYMIKQRGGMLAKGRLLGIQFLTLFEKNLYLSIASHANKMAQEMQSAMISEGTKFFVETTTNQIFPILPNTIIKKLEEKYAFQVWEKIDDTHTAMRFVTSWATREEDVHNFISDFKQIKQEH
ncbi:MAG: low specificity L-threonine aldolase [Longicatena sp.]